MEDIETAKHKNSAVPITSLNILESGHLCSQDRRGIQWMEHQWLDLLAYQIDIT